MSIFGKPTQLVRQSATIFIPPNERIREGLHTVFVHLNSTTFWIASYESKTCFSWSVLTQSWRVFMVDMIRGEPLYLLDLHHLPVMTLIVTNLRQGLFRTHEWKQQGARSWKEERYQQKKKTSSLKCNTNQRANLSYCHHQQHGYQLSGTWQNRSWDPD